MIRVQIRNISDEVFGQTILDGCHKHTEDVYSTTFEAYTESDLVIWSSVNPDKIFKARYDEIEVDGVVHEDANTTAEEMNKFIGKSRETTSGKWGEIVGDINNQHDLITMFVQLEDSISSIYDSLDYKVDKETGKALSTNDFTNDYKDIVDDAVTYDENEQIQLRSNATTIMSAIGTTMLYCNSGTVMGDTSQNTRIKGLAQRPSYETNESNHDIVIEPMFQLRYIDPYNNSVQTGYVQNIIEHTDGYVYFSASNDTPNYPVGGVYRITASEATRILYTSSIAGGIPFLFSAYGNIYGAYQSDGNYLLRINQDGTYKIIFGSTGGAHWDKVIVASNGKCYLAGYLTGLYELNEDDTIIQRGYFNTSLQFLACREMFEYDGKLYISTVSNTIGHSMMFTYDLATEEFNMVFNGGPLYIAYICEHNGEIYGTSEQNPKIIYKWDGVNFNEFQTLTSDCFKFHKVTVGGADHLYIGTKNANEIFKFDGSQFISVAMPGTVTVEQMLDFKEHIYITTSLPSPTGVSLVRIDPSGHVMFADNFRTEGDSGKLGPMFANEKYIYFGRADKDRGYPIFITDPTAGDPWVYSDDGWIGMPSKFITDDKLATVLQPLIDRIEALEQKVG